MAGRKGKILHVHGINLSSLVLSIWALNTLYVWSKEYLHFTPLRLSTPSLSAWLTLLFSRPTVKNENRKHFKRLWYKCHSHEIYFSLDVLCRVGHVSPPLKKNANYGADRSIHNFSTEFQLHPTSFPPPVHNVASYLSHASRPGQRSSHFKEMWNYFGKIKLAKDKIKRALKTFRL